MDLVLGPLVRYVDATSATVWVETSAHCAVSVMLGDRSWTRDTFAVHGHHYALVDLDGLQPGAVTPYQVRLEARAESRVVWPPQHQELDLPASVISTMRTDRAPRFAFGSCRTSVDHDALGNATHGVDALRAYALAMAGITHQENPSAATTSWPDFVLFLGDQVYADETSAKMREYIASRRSLAEPPGAELKDFEEYAHLYLLAWSDPANRWLLSTLSSAMIFDDHDVRDDWNTSARWRREMQATDWWQERIVAALASYWVYQHAGNLSARERADDEIWSRVLAHAEPEELDLTEELDRFAARADAHPDSYRWSFARDLQDARLVVVDSRAARVLDLEHRAMIDDDELAWLDRQLTGGVQHLFVGTSLPYLLPAGLQHVEAFSEALERGVWGVRAARIGERVRERADLEHWGAFQQSFRDVARMVIEVATGRRGAPPCSITFLSGDVHHSYVSEVTLSDQDSTDGAPTSRIVQMVCSPIRNPLPRGVRVGTAALAHGLAARLGRLAARAAGVPPLPFTWTRVQGPWFDNNLATLEVDDHGLEAWWQSGHVVEGHHERPQLRRVAYSRLEC